MHMNTIHGLECVLDIKQAWYKKNRIIEDFNKLMLTKFIVGQNLCLFYSMH